MATNSHNLTRKGSILPPSVTEFLQKRAIEAFGISLILSALALIAAFLSYNPADPSLNTASSLTAANLLGTTGAWVADMFMQSIGLAGWVLPAVTLAWGWRIITHRGLGHLWLRLTFLPITMLTAAIALAGPETSASWELKTGYGGVAGDIALAATAGWSAHLTPFGTDAVAAAATVLAIGALVGAFGFSAAEWRQFGKTLRWLGYHGAAASAAGGRAGIQAGKWSFNVAKKGGSAARQRLEPKLFGDEEEADEFDVDDSLEIDTKRKKREPRLSGATRETKKEIVAPRTTKAKPGKKAEAARQTKLDLGSAGEYEMPDIDLLETIITEDKSSKSDEEALAENARLLESVLEDFGVQGEVVKVRPGPVVTLYEFEPAPGIKSSRVIGLADDIARSMSAISARVAVVQGRNAMGIELPNANREIVSLRELLESETLEKNTSKLSLALGKDIGGGPTIADLARMPHLLIAGTTGSGKSVAINTMILSLLYRLSPEHCRLVMIDPKMLELSVYDGIPHLLCPVVTDPKKAVVALRWTVREMEQRYRAMSTMGVRNIAGYNSRLEEARKNGEALTRTVQTGFDSETGEPIYEDQPLDMSPLPFIVVIVDEMADLMLVAGKEVEASVQRIAQMARAAGIHLIMATQRPSVDVITGTIKANFPTRISFQVTSKIDSRTILGEAGAEQLLGQGDMLFMAGGGRISRVHGPLVTDEEVERVVTTLKAQGMPEYIEEVTQEEPGSAIGGGGSDSSEGDALYDDAVALVCRERKASTSFVQRHLSIGYNRAARIVDQMEAEGVISAANHVGKREVLARDIDNREA
ncbi:MAG: cell division protein FtsK [Alphaproteobacteria bacterium]|nr:cell division protein FtsK [Alphaproteobacteria bacterium]